MDGTSLQCPHVEEGLGALWVSPKRALISSRGPHPHDLIAPEPLLLTPSHWGLGFKVQIWGTQILSLFLELSPDIGHQRRREVGLSPSSPEQQLSVSADDVLQARGLPLTSYLSVGQESRRVR